MSESGHNVEHKEHTDAAPSHAGGHAHSAHEGHSHGHADEHAHHTHNDEEHHAKKSSQEQHDVSAAAAAIDTAPPPSDTAHTTPHTAAPPSNTPLPEQVIGAAAHVGAHVHVDPPVAAAAVPMDIPQASEGGYQHQAEPKAEPFKMMPDELPYPFEGTVSYFMLTTNTERFKPRGRVVFPRQVENHIFESMHLLAKLVDTVAFANQSYPIIASEVKELILAFLKMKLEQGTDIEKRVYQALVAGADEAAVVAKFIHRLLVKRPLMFMTGRDEYMLRSLQEGYDEFVDLPTRTESDPLLENYISYDEMQISALLGVSVRTHFINTGTRTNYGRYQHDQKFQPDGVYVGLVGARFERRDLMEWQHMIVSPLQNTPENGYGRDGVPKRELEIWANFYGQQKSGERPYFPSFDEVEKSDEKEREKNFLYINYLHVYLNINVYKLRLRAVLAPFFQDANIRGTPAKPAYTHLVGLGLGVWQVANEQGQYFVEVVDSLLHELELPHVSDVDFSWFPYNCTSCGGIENGGHLVGKAGNQITIRFSRRNPADPIEGNKMLVAMYAWDSNSFPGNEYWVGSLSASGDPAAACCSTISFLQNPYINPKIAGNNTHFSPAFSSPSA